jgi:hypothetical protein
MGHLRRQQRLLDDPRKGHLPLKAVLLHGLLLALQDQLSDPYGGCRAIGEVPEQTPVIDRVRLVTAPRA